jgi:hypothetical protein
MTLPLLVCFLMLSSSFSSEISDVIAPAGYTVIDVSTFNDVSIYSLLKTGDSSHVYTIYKNSLTVPITIYYQFNDGTKESGPFYYHLKCNANISDIPVPNTISSNFSHVCITSIDGSNLTANKMDMNAPKGFTSSNLTTRNDVVIYVMIKDDDQMHLYTYYLNRNSYPIRVNYTFSNGIDDYGNFYFLLKENEKRCKDPIANDVPVAYRNVRITSVARW